MCPCLCGGQPPPSAWVAPDSRGSPSKPQLVGARVSAIASTPNPGGSLPPRHTIPLTATESPTLGLRWFAGLPPSAVSPIGRLVKRLRAHLVTMPDEPTGSSLRRLHATLMSSPTLCTSSNYDPPGGKVAERPLHDWPDLAPAPRLQIEDPSTISPSSIGPRQSAPPSTSTSSIRAPPEPAPPPRGSNQPPLPAPPH